MADDQTPNRKDQLADDLKALIDRFEAEIATLPAGPLRTAFEKDASVMHRAAERSRNRAHKAKMISLMSGGGPKEP